MSVFPFRYPEEKREQLEALRKAKGHRSVSDVLREAVDEYLARELPSLADAA